MRPHPVNLLDLEAEQVAWSKLTALVRSLTPAERLEPGYYRDPDWSVRDLAAHLGTWLAQADVEFERMSAGTYDGHDIDVDGLNAALLEAMRDQPWSVVWVQANAARTKWLERRLALHEENAEVEWWIAKSGLPHYGEHLTRLRAWAVELADRRTATVPPAG
jgi:hypothetical protein